MKIQHPSEWKWLRLCARCGSLFPKTGNLVCEICWSHLQQFQSEKPFSRQREEISILGFGLWSWVPGQDETLSRVLVQLKGGRPRDVLNTLACEIWIRRQSWDPEVPMITFVPAPSTRPPEEDHALVLAQALCALVPGSRVWKGLIKVGQRHQRRLSRSQRQDLRIECEVPTDNLLPEFLENLSRRQQVVLVDDIVTTGATAIGCARALKLKHLEVWCLAERVLPCDRGVTLL